MFKPIFAATVAIAAITAAPAAFASDDIARDKYAGVFDDSNSHYLDYKTDLSEARRELKNDLAGADSDADRAEVISEFEREVADAESDFIKEMAEDGVVLRRGRVTVEDEIAALVAVPRY
ncbi:hypothetical protein COC42_14000 [Sphingomonas spermidinifaciens]|uniref:Uncharacterized protein n=1 Tax=Sphingomonas spermidinifaciens TaxID=1141889 RepID=A0A2A4B3J6_9SPHN|nr:hypothetical protein [Sphingomonas spermidinifaciens]PCD02522.1 hypothetical protein COC42_14000 [Sphingomonas spermidinifaciens]